MASVNTEENIYQQISRANDEFFNGFYSNVAEKTRDNIICSSLSAHIVLSMMACGARGKTAEELGNSLHLSGEDSLVYEGYKSLLDSLNNVTEIELHLANKIYIQENVSLFPEFLSMNSKFFNSELSKINFKEVAESAKLINSWVEKQTNNRIQNLVSAETIDQSTKMILINAIYFKGTWAAKFDPESTENRPFYITKDTKRHVPMMFKKSNYRHAKLDKLNSRVIELPYSNEDFSMYIILPNELEGLRYVEKNFDKESMKVLEWKSKETDLFLPKFKIEFTIDLKKTLQKIGMGVIFSDDADFSGITETRLKVDDVIQKAFILVNEEGSEAAVVTKARLRCRRAIKLETFIVDRPFMFTIQHRPSNITIFAGSIRDLQMLPERDEL